jgi:PPM family protein phosphatase
MSLKLQAAAKTDVGRQREQNEDCPYVSISEEQERGLFIVADGMGGYRAGEVASRLAVQKMSEALRSFLLPISEQPTVKLAPLSDADIADMSTVKFDAGKVAEQATKSRKTHKLTETPTIKSIEDSLKDAVRRANRAIISYGEEQSGARGLGCTVTSALIQEDRASIVNVGDSRTYLLRNGELSVLTRDHSLVQRLVEEKQITPDDVYTHPQRNLIYKSLGAGHKSVDPDVFHQQLQHGDMLLLCSDGLWEMVRRQDLISILQQEDDPQQICNRLIDTANANGGEDNITAIVVKVQAG